MNKQFLFFKFQDNPSPPLIPFSSFEKQEKKKKRYYENDNPAKLSDNKAQKKQ